METKPTENHIHRFPDSKYRLILVAAARSKQLQKGREPRLRSSSHKPTRIALEEVSQGLVPFEVLPPRQSTIPHHEDGIISV
ncbi:DNA-directed RNA polymerase subunit omega [Chloracidobacterium sp. E]|uniref:DNA-directed RNA polymerase subunit omega n=2 Tax=Chloracidobacterium TaxID=458032 RepID=A0ABX8B1S8_9BACT|nr:DNA-directed RNA polymerase subunit omega [Chloracidobacterium sp. 2]QUV88835.1 DNA-directed RNA polymerase subunit omega [Chloracidobacterium sp. S]QUV91896.1 DNA-directed RNA polymerase subunit omega [Chloracidobacterium sp. A]QUV94928.1 DNA-directed RNA polymerase subunit omega [Chloracidobacterium sp. N]QUV97988.1 DNA-directed RNA polymerase subunit omega [Chloracidobacterium sp. E]